MLEGFCDGKGVEVAPTLLAIFKNAAQVMPSNLHGQRVGNDVSRLFLVLGPSRMSKSDPDRTPVDKEFHVHCIGVAGCNGHYDALKDTADLGSGPALDGAEVFVHKIYVRL